MKIKRDYDWIIDEIKAIDIGLMFLILRFIYEESHIKKEFPEIDDHTIFDLARLIIHKNRRLKYKDLLRRVILRNKYFLSSLPIKFDTIKDIEENILNNDDYIDGQKVLTIYSLFLDIMSGNVFHGEKFDYLKNKTIEFRRITDEEKENDKNSLEILETIELDDNHRFTNYIGALNDMTNKKKLEDFLKYRKPEEIAKQFFCNYNKRKKRYNNVKWGILYFLAINFDELILLKSDIKDEIERLKDESSKFNEMRQFLDIKKENYQKLKDNILQLKLSIRNLRKTNKKLLDKILKKIDKSSNKDLENQNYNLKKDNYYLQTRLEKLEEQVAVFEEEKRLNTELSDNITIEEKPVTKQVNKPEYMNIVVAGGRWTSDNREKVCLYLPDNEIEFIEADKILRNYDKIANCDIIFFDTSYNSHAYYYKLKKCSGDFYHINASNLLEFEKIYEGE